MEWTEELIKQLIAEDKLRCTNVFLHDNTVGAVAYIEYACLDYPDYYVATQSDASVLSIFSNIDYFFQHPIHTTCLLNYHNSPRQKLKRALDGISE